MVRYAEIPTCRRSALLEYFGEAFAETNCGGCDNCLSPRETFDGTMSAQKFLSCVYRIRQHSHFGVGLNHVIEVLTGADTDKVTADLNVLNATNSLLGLIRLAGRNVHELTGSDAKQLEQSVKSSSFVLYSGKRDRLLRKVDVAATFGFDVPKQLANALGAVGAKVEFELGVANPNKPVSVNLP